MPRLKSLGPIEQFVLAAVSLLGDSAYPVRICEKVRWITQRPIQPRSIHASLSRLTKKGFVTTIERHDRWGQARRTHIIYKPTGSGAEEIYEWFELQGRLARSYEARKGCLRIAVAYDAPADKSRPDEDAEEAKAMAEFISETGHDAWACSISGMPDFFSLLQCDKPDIVFNLFAPHWTSTVRAEADIVAMCELFNINYVGSNALTLRLTHRKDLCNALLRERGVRVPEGIVMHDWKHLQLPPALTPPWIVKPAEGGASHGINPGSVVSDKKEPPGPSAVCHWRASQARSNRRVHRWP